MKRLNFSLLALLLIVLMGCEEQERAFPEFGDGDVQTGAFARRISPIEGNFNFFDPAGSNVSFDVEFYDVNEGRDVAEYNWTATYSIPDSMDSEIGPVEVLSIPASSFVTSEFGLPSTTVTFNLAEVLEDLEIDQEDLNQGDQLRFRSTIVLNDGRTFDRANTGNNIITGRSFNSPFIVDQFVICPSDLSASVSYEQTTNPWPDGCGSQTLTGTQELVEESEGIYFVEDFSFGGYLACYDDSEPPGGNLDEDGIPSASLRLQEVCGRLQFIGTDRYGDAWEVSDVVVDGNQLTFTWRSAYGESGRVTLTRAEGEWPDNLFA